ncbi:MAG: NAD(P)-dependent oxidoreductase, partial [Clostridiaceae bacterium]
GGAFDVFNTEPLPLDSPFLALDNVVLTPHLCGASLAVVKNHSRMATEDIALFAAGKRPVRLANKEVLS